MSRDFTPKEQFLADYALKNTLRNSELTWTNRWGKTFRLDNFIAKDRYPELSFLYRDFDSLYKKYADDEKALGVLDRIERAVMEAEDECLNGYSPFTTAMEITVQEWFEGRLAPHFHYHMENDRIFSEFINKQLRDAVKE